jgi:hypothetical protein
MSIEDDARSGRPKEAVSDEIIKKVHKIMFNDRKVKLSEIAETLKISKKRVEHIVHEYLDMQKLCDDWLAMLTTNPKVPGSNPGYVMVLFRRFSIGLTIHLVKK